MRAGASVITRCQGGCYQAAVVRIMFRCDGDFPVDIDFCVHHFNRHSDVAKVAENFICAVPLAEDGSPIPVPEASA